MGYYTTVKTVNKDGKVVKAEVFCGGTSKGFTDANTGEISFDMYSNDIYDVYAKSSVYGNGNGKVKGGGIITIRLN
jgi:hypothetical protein